MYVAFVLPEQSRALIISDYFMYFDSVCIYAWMHAFHIRVCIFVASVATDLLNTDVTDKNNLGQSAVPGSVFG